VTPKEFVEWVIAYPNSKENHHPNECDLHKTPEDEWNEDTTCTCGYWAEAFTQIKIAAMKTVS
jgi:hypothetical protein